MSTKTYTIRLDETDKKRAEQVFKELGMTFATGMNLYVKTVGRQKKIPFDLDVSEHISKINGTDNIKMGEIDAEISAYRQERED